MSTRVAISLPWGRFHATPWDRNANEGAVEWPPSPWRLLRALYAVWRNRAWELAETDVVGLLRQLAAPPSYLLPCGRPSSTRHYFPDRTSGPPKWNPTARGFDLRRTDKVLDGFMVTAPDAELLVDWPVDLGGPARDALGTLASRLTYLGRAESVCQARLVDVGPMAGEWWRPAATAVSGSARLLCAAQPLDLASLLQPIAVMRRAGHLSPSGAEWRAYTPGPVVEPARGAVEVPTPEAKATAIRWSLAAPAPPALTAAVAMSEVLRRATHRQFGGQPSAALAGKDPASGVKSSGHRHSHWLALDLDDDKLIDTLVLWLPAGIGPQELRAAAAVDRLIGHGHVPDFRPCRLGLDAFGPVATVASKLVGPAARWVSHTPFAPPRHQKRRQPFDAYLAGQVRDELERRGFPAPSQVTVLGVGALPAAPLAYRRHRLGEKLEQSRPAFGLSLAFDQPVRGPIALGALSHFGLGLFLPVGLP